MMAPSRLLGHGTITWIHHPSPLSIPLKPSPSHESTTTLLDICRRSTPPCDLNPFLFNGHLQTCWAAVEARDIRVYYKRRVFGAEDPAVAGTFAVDFVVAPYGDADERLPPRTTFYAEGEYEGLGSRSDTTPMVVTLHGLSGGSHEVYLKAVLKPLIDAGWAACVMISRGCAMSKITTGLLYNARATWDVRQIVKELRRKWPKRPLFGIGFSLGANILVNYLGEEGAHCELKAAVVCSNPWNLEVGSLALQRTWLGLEIYSKTMGDNMRKLFETHVDQISKIRDIDLEKVRGVRYLHDFDREVQAPTWGYPTEGAYYRDASSCDSLLAVRIPLFAINAEDDPIAVNEAIPVNEIRQNPYIILCRTSSGGHLSWFEIGGGRWYAKPAVNFLRYIAEIVDSEKSVEAIDFGFVDHRVPADNHSFLPMRRRMERSLQQYPTTNVKLDLPTP